MQILKLWAEKANLQISILKSNDLTLNIRKLCYKKYSDLLKKMLLNHKNTTLWKNFKYEFWERINKLVQDKVAVYFLCFLTGYRKSLCFLNDVLLHEREVAKI